MQPITYSLKNQQKRSDEFFLELSDFTDVVLAEIQARCGTLIEDILRRPHQEEVGPQRTLIDHAFDLLVLGVLWQVYAEKAESLGSAQKQVINRLLKLRRKSELLKPAADFVRGIFGGLIFSRAGRRQSAPEPELAELAGLMEWLDVTGEFEEEARRLRVWHAFLSGQSGQDQTASLEAIIGLGKWFENASLECLGVYTPHVDPFLNTWHVRYRWREDYLLAGRQRVEYHMNMVGMEMMNRSFREEFLQAERKFIFVPPCMSAPQDGKCQATQTAYGERCAACTPTCQVHQVTRLGEKLGIQVFMIPDSFSPLATSNGTGLGTAQIGVVGVACPLMIVNGGYEMKRLGIPAQGLLLDHCGCHWHWDPGKGIVTEINIKQLTRILAPGKVVVQA